MKLTFAFAVNNENNFEKQHFGDADKFQIYEIKNNKFILISELKNIFKSEEHGDKNKADKIINLLKDNNVNILVSMQFGRNIKFVNQHFIPVIIYNQQPKEVIEIIEKHLRWIDEELRLKTDNYRLFTIKSGIMKSIIQE